jgi:peptidoglycan/LPS O-acetylase OafA/YrhL
MAVGTPSAGLASQGMALPTSVTRGRELRNHNFDYLRLFLAVEVVAMHLNAGLLLGNLWVPIPPVAAFVALSGFLIPQSLERSRGLKHFAWKRALRTLPALVPLMLAIGVVFGLKDVERAIVQYVSAGYHSLFRGCVLPLWSLIVEDGLYAVVALLFVLGSHRKAWVTLLIIGGLMAVQANIEDHVFDYRFLQTSIAFFIGNLAFIFKDRLAKLHWAAPAVALGASLTGWSSFLGPFNFPLIIGCVVVLAMTLPQIKWGIPDLSYSIYIWHAPIMLALLGPWAMPRDARWVTTTVALTLVASTLSWYLVEKPALRLKDWSRAKRDVASSESTPSLQTDDSRIAA